MIMLRNKKRIRLWSSLFDPITNFRNFVFEMIRRENFKNISHGVDEKNVLRTLYDLSRFDSRNSN